MSTPDSFRARLDGMVDPRHPLVVLTGRLPWAQIEQVLAPHFERKARTPGTATARDMLGEHELEFGVGVGSGGRPRLPVRLMASLLYLKNSFNLSDEELAARWSENVVWQFFSSMEYYEPRLACDATQIGRFRTAIGEEGLEQLLKFTVLTAVEIKAIKPAIGHAKSDHRMDRCWLKGAIGDALHAISCAAGYNIRWLMRAIVAQAAKAAKAAFLTLSKPALYGLNSAMDALIALRDVLGLITNAPHAGFTPPLSALPAGSAVESR